MRAITIKAQNIWSNLDRPYRLIYENLWKAIDGNLQTENDHR